MCPFANEDTIAAIATPKGQGGVGIIRISGKNLASFISSISKLTNYKPRYAYFSSFYTDDGDTIDSGILLFFKGPHSFTGEDVVELQAHGGMVVLQMLLKRCIELGARLALPGEFSQRAFLNNKIDLIQAESIADLINASSEDAAKMATRSLQGQFSKHIESLQQEIIQIRTLVEGTIDFPEEDIDSLVEANVTSRLSTIFQQLNATLTTAEQGAILREGITLVLLGAPNVGKSSLLNVLAENEVAIVTDIAGTTRDVIQEEITIEGVKLHLLDTAGLRKTNDLIETIGIEKSHRSLKTADMVLIVIDPREGINETTEHILQDLPSDTKRIYLHNKIDLIKQTPDISYHESDGYPLIKISVKERAGIDLLKQEILRQVGYFGEHEGLFLARTRHVDVLTRVQKEIQLAIANNTYLDLLAEHLRIAQIHLNEITGEYTSDDLLGNIFSQFCIGK